MLATVTVTIELTVKVVKILLLAVSAALTVNGPDAEVERVTLVWVNPCALEVLVVGFSEAWPAGEMVQVTAAPEIGFTPLESLTRTTRGLARPWPALLLCPLPLETVIAPATPGVTEMGMLKDSKYPIGAVVPLVGVASTPQISALIVPVPETVPKTGVQLALPLASVRTAPISAPKAV